MRNLSSAALNIFGQSGIEPVLLIKVFWNDGNGIIYSDRRFEEYGFKGLLINVGTVDDVVNVDNSGSTAQVDVTLDDTDGSLKSIFNTSDIHKTKVQLLQWCTDLPPSEAFVIFTGQISSPIEWTEGDRTLKFDVLTQIEDREVGFSIEDGTFKLFPSRLIGQAWPIVFGKVLGLKPLQILEAPSGIIATGLGIVDNKVWQNEINALNIQRAIAIGNARDAFNNGVAEALIASRYKGQFLSFLTNDLSTAQSHDLAADNYYAQAAAFTDDAANIAREITLKKKLWDLQKSYDKFTFPINSINMPSNVPLTFQLGSATYTGTYNNGLFHTTSRKFPEDFGKKPTINTIGRTTTTQGVKTSDIYGNGPQQLDFGQKFSWVDGGTEIHVTNFPLTYVISVGPAAVTGVYAYRHGVRSPVPANYYTLFNQQFGNTTCTLITLVMPLTARTFFNGVNQISEGWDGDAIEVDAESTIGPNTIDIMVWVITLFTKFNIDWDSFNVVREYLLNYPMNFALTSKKNVVNFLQEMAFQARCSIWLNDDTFFVRYLPVPPTPIETITDDDIVLNSLIVTCSDTESIITSYTATWKPNLFQKDDFKIIYKYNIPKYGFKEGSYSYYAYNIESLVAKSAEFWMIRKSNTFKILKFKTTLHKLRIESFDAITINIEPGIVCNGPVVGTVLKAIYNTTDKTIDVEVWLPIRFGEMDIFPFAEPYNLSTVYPLLDDPNLKTQNPFELAGTLPQQQFVLEQHSPFQHYLGILPSSAGRFQSVGDEFDSYVTPPDYPTSSLPVDPSRIGDLPQTNNYLQYDVNPITTPNIKEATNAGFPGKVIGLYNKDQQTYLVNVYFAGFDSNPTSVVVKQFVINPDDEISAGTPVEVKRLVFLSPITRQTEIILWMQATIWQPAKTDSDETSGSGTGSTSPGTDKPVPADGEEDTGSGGSEEADVTDEGASNESDE